SEEAVSGGAVAINELPFINIHSHLAKADVAVPELFFYDQTAGLLYLQDFGDVVLAEACRTVTEAEIAALYRDAVETLARLHLRATTPANQACLAFRRGFDAPLLMWEFEHFLEYGVAVRQGKAMPERDLLAVRAEFQKIADLMANR